MAQKSINIVITSRHVLSIALFFSVAMKAVLRLSLLNKIEVLLIFIVCLHYVSASHLYFSTDCPLLFPLSFLCSCSDCLYLAVLLALFSFPASYLFFIFLLRSPAPSSITLLFLRINLFILRCQAIITLPLLLSLCATLWCESDYGGWGH